MIKIHHSNLQSFCRTCLNHLETTSSSSFHINQTPKLIKLLIICTSLNINEDDAVYPQNVCSKCYITIQQFCDFREMAHQSAEVLQRIIENADEDSGDILYEKESSETGDSVDRLEGIKIEIEDTILQESNFTNTSAPISSNNRLVHQELRCTFDACCQKFKNKRTLNNHIKLKHTPAQLNILNHKFLKINQETNTSKEDIPHKFEHGEESESSADQPMFSLLSQTEMVNSKNPKTPTKRRNSITDTDHVDTKRLCGELVTYGQHSTYDIRNTHQFRTNLSHTLIGAMYQLDLSVLCSLRYSACEQKYPLLSLTFNDVETDKFNSIVFHYEGKSTRVQVENVDQCYTDNAISYANLFPKKTNDFSIIDYFNSFARHVLLKPQNFSSNIEQLIVYTKTGLDLTADMKLKKGRFKNFYPFEFKSINLEKSFILKEFLFTNNDLQGRGFYQFMQNNTTREEFIKRLDFSIAMQKAIKAANISPIYQREIKEMFFNKLIFAAKQPNREELNGIVKNELKKHSETQDNYMGLQEKIFSVTSVKQNKFSAEISDLMYEFKLLMTFVNSMILHKNIFSVNFEEKSHCISINNEGRITYVKAHNTVNIINFSNLFPSNKKKDGKCTLSINKQFALFVDKLNENVEHFIIYTNTNLNLTKDNILQKGQTKDFYRLKFENINILAKKYEILNNCACFNANNLYKLAKEYLTKKSVLCLLKLPPFLEKERKEGRLSQETEKKIKVQFLSKLIFAVNQYDIKGLNSLLNIEASSSNVPYNHEMLNEVSLRWLESHGLNSITEETIQKLFEDIANNRSSYQKNENHDFEKVQFVKRVVGKEETTAFNQLLLFLTQGEGKKYLEVLNINQINLTNVSSILSGSRGNASKTFKGLYDLWFDEDGNKTKYLKTLETKEINLASISSILNGVGANAPKAFKELFDLWFPEEEYKTEYLDVLEKEQISLSKMSSILSGAGVNAAKAFKELYELWFDEQDNKTIYLRTLEVNGINLSNVSSIIGGAGTSAANAFIGLYNLWFDEEGNKTLYLKTLEDNEINLTNITSILGGAGNNGAKSFKDLHNLWFDERGHKTVYLRNLEKEGINSANLSSILNKSRSNAAKVFKDLYDLWFDEQGNKTKYLTNLEKEDLKLWNLSGMLSGSGSNATSTFKNLYNRLVDKTEIQTERLKLLNTLKKKKMNLQILLDT